MRSYAVVLFAATLSVASPVLAEITFSPAGSAQVAYQDGLMQLAVSAPGSEGIFMPLALSIDDRAQGEFLLGVQNNTDMPITLTAENVVVTDDRGRVVPMLTEAQLALQADRQARGRRYWNRFAYGLAGMGAGQSTTTGSFRASNPYDPFSAVNGTYTENTYNPAQAAAETRALAASRDQSLAAVEQRRQQDVERSQSHGFRPDTVEPGEVYLTGITLDRLDRRARLLTVRVTFGADVHEYQLTLSR